MKTIIPIESHQQMKQRHSQEISNQKGLFWAFSKEQLNEGLLKINSKIEDVVSIGAGGIIRKDEIDNFKALLKRHELERKELKNNLSELYKALVYELNNHEYCITYNPQDALDALGLTKEELPEGMLRKACKQSITECA